MTPNAERRAQELVSREVLLDISGVVDKLSRCDSSLFDESPGLLSAHDIRGAVVKWLYEQDCDTIAGDLTQFLAGHDDAGSTVSDAEKEAFILGLDDETIAAIAQKFNIEPHYLDVLEHWAVTDWLAGKLIEQGETVEEVAGLNVWCRTTSGQAIAMDGCIQRVLASIEEG